MIIGFFSTLEFLAVCIICAKHRNDKSLLQCVSWALFEMILFFIIIGNTDPVPFVCGWKDENTIIWEFAVRLAAVFYILVYSFLKMNIDSSFPQ
mmetsp:Transcript_43277/g.38511  ORF Transcript_43277/g.38511 Transcript_43277/m.38511 type:complete len:94 (+) Transcript_43277:443-724(+)